MNQPTQRSNNRNGPGGGGRRAGSGDNKGGHRHKRNNSKMRDNNRPGGRGNPDRGAPHDNKNQQKANSHRRPIKSTGPRFSKMDPRYTWDEKALQPDPVQPQKSKRIHAIFFETFDEARSATQQLAELKSQCDQLNIVIRQEGDMNDQALLAYGKVFAGAAWTLIHERRRDEGWYQATHSSNH